ncbi:MAG: molybdopterin-dependent oxidoreductase [Candidatus Nezhaarchaeales archaeon]
MKIVKTACGLCYLGCGMNVYVDNGKMVKVEGILEHPLNRGVLCPKGLAAIDYAYSSDRLKYPLRRRGEGFVETTWSEALDNVSSKLREYAKNYGAKSVVGIIGMPILLGGYSTVSLVRRFYDVYGSPNVFSPESICYRNQIIAYILTLGKFCVAEPEKAKCVILWGSNPHHSRPPWVKRIQEALNKGASLIVIDPRRIPFARMAALHLQPRPGTDAALALGMINVITSEGLYDKEFVERWTFGFEKLVDHVKAYTPERVEEITWVPAFKVREAARTFAAAKPACIIQGVNALDQTAAGFYTARAIAILQAITGNVDVPGGFVRASRVHLSPIRLPEKIKERPLGADKYPLFYECWGRLFGEGQAMLLADAILSGEPYPVKMVMVTASNPLLTWPNAKKVKEALEAVDFLVVVDVFMTETAKLADLVLPASSFLERMELCDYYGTVNGIPYVMLRKEVIKPLWGSWPDWRIWFELAAKMGFQEYFPWRSIEEYLDYVLKPSGLTVKYLLEEKPEGVPYGRINYYEYKEVGFKTPSGKVEIYSKTLEEYGYNPLPVHLEPRESPLSNPKLAEEYPLILTTGSRIIWFLHSQLRNVKRLRDKYPESLAEINPSTANRYGVSDGQLVTIETLRGRIRVKVKTTEDIAPGIINVSHGWVEANVNILTSEEPENQVVGFPGLKAELCRITKA